jgi:hypothetical protein
MEPLEKCMSMLRVLIKEGNAQALPLAERAINEFIAAHDGTLHKSDALGVLEGEILDFGETKGPSDLFVNMLLDYIDDRIIGLRRDA